VDHALGRRRNNGQTNLGEREGRRIEHLAQLRGHVAPVDLLLARSRHQIARQQRAPGKVALERGGGALKAQVALGGRKDHALRGARFDPAHLDMLARADIGIGTLKPVETDQFETFILGIGSTARAAVLRLPIISITSPSATPRRPMTARLIRAMPWPDSSCRDPATCKRAIF
jgi:hypothetical protein